MDLPLNRSPVCCEFQQNVSDWVAGCKARALGAFVVCPYLPREILLPHYRILIPIIRSTQVSVVSIDQCSMGLSVRFESIRTIFADQADNFIDTII